MVFVLDGGWGTSESKFLGGLRSRRMRLVESVIAILNCLNAYNTTNFARGYRIISSLVVQKVDPPTRPPVILLGFVVGELLLQAVSDASE